MSGAAQATRGSTRRLSEVARHLVIPEGIVTTGWPQVEAQCREWGVEFDEWQRGLGRVALGKRESGEYAATIGGITMSIPRQVAKTFWTSRTVFALCAQFPGLRVLWTAHRARTATNTFRSLQGFSQRKAVAPFVRSVRQANGEQEIEFRNGSIIMFGAREAGFGRGFDEVDVIVFDEAQILTVRALEDMVATTNQSRHPHGALLFFMGTPPRPVDPGEAFTLRRKEALAGEMVDGVYLECSADPVKARANPDDRERWAEANASFPHRTPERSMLRLRKNLPGDDSWLREALGVWDEETIGRRVIPADRWAELAAESAPDGPVAYGVKFSPDGEMVALAVAVKAGDSVHVEGVEHRRVVDGTLWLVEWLAARWRDCSAIVVDGKSGAGALVKALERAGVQRRRIVTPTVDQVVAAHAGLLDAVTTERPLLTHNGDAALDDAVWSAGRRPIGKSGGWGFESLDGGPVTLLEAVTLAHWAALSARRPSRGEGRRVVVL